MKELRDVLPGQLFQFRCECSEEEKNEIFRLKVSHNDGTADIEQISPNGKIMEVFHKVSVFNEIQRVEIVEVGELKEGAVFFAHDYTVTFTVGKKENGFVYYTHPTVEYDMFLPMKAKVLILK